ncbi:MAG TPA: hypothetical protein VHU17_09035, partial [Acidimicrobiales bacterium]|nr:hypothetical protein [Acidimicrobiales bacterium]
KLLSGVQNITSNGTQGANPRFASVGLTRYELSYHGKESSGYGPGAVSVYWPAEYPPTLSFAPRPNSLWEEMWFDFGVYGLVIFVLLLIPTIWRMRKYPAAMALILPFMVASMVNSTGPELYKWTFLAIYLFGFGWLPARDLDHIDEGEAPDRSVGADRSSPGADLQLIAETTGHADVIREAVSGASPSV